MERREAISSLARNPFVAALRILSPSTTAEQNGCRLPHFPKTEARTCTHRLAKNMRRLRALESCDCLPPRHLAYPLKSFRVGNKGNSSVCNTGKIPSALAYIRRASPIDDDGSRTLQHCINTESDLQLRLVEALGGGRRPRLVRAGKRRPTQAQQ
jgi:hypothetical protein